MFADVLPYLVEEFLTKPRRWGGEPVVPITRICTRFSLFVAFASVGGGKGGGGTGGH